MDMQEEADVVDQPVASSENIFHSDKENDYYDDDESINQDKDEPEEAEDEIVSEASVAVASIQLSSRLNSADLAAFATRYDITQGDEIVHYELPWWHPEIEWAIMTETGGPSFHPNLDNDPEFQRFIRANTDENHQFLDPDTDGFVQFPDKTWMPRGHPIIDDYFIHQEFPEDRLPSVPSHHPDPQEAFLNGEQLPKGHPSISLQLQGIIPEGHPDVNDLFLEGLRELPEWHPEISMMVQPRQTATSPASILCYSVGAILILLALARAVTKWRNSKRTREVIVNRDSLDMRSISSNDKLAMRDTLKTHSSDDNLSQSGGFEVVASKAVPVVGPDQSSDHAMILRDLQQDDSLNTNEERVLVYKEKKASWKSVFGKRAIKSNHSSGEAINCLLYVFINIMALFASPTYDVGVGLGSLSVGNIFFLFLTAARNGFLSWAVGVSFEQALVYHRFIGRLTVLLGFIHGCFHIDYITQKTSEQITITGLISLGFGVIIVLSSLNVIRRRYFNAFYWSHFAFIGFIVGVCLHSKAAQPFIIASVVCYGLDKGLQLMWKWTIRTTVFQQVDSPIVHCQFPKSSISSLLGRHEVGQYVFVNFPSLSLNEWHPFSVSSGPNDDHIDVYIKSLGNHTKKIVEYAERCEAENKQVKIRCDGPYGSLPFNYRRYGSILFVVGGVGITPALSLLRDIYQNQADTCCTDTTQKKPLSCIREVTLLWVIPYASDALFLLDQLNTFHSMSIQNPHLPDLKLSIHVTRSSGGNSEMKGQQFLYSRPQFDDVMDECITSEPEEKTSTLVYACGPTKMVNQLWDASTKKNTKNSRCDFYHETFEL